MLYSLQKRGIMVPLKVDNARTQVTRKIQQQVDYFARLGPSIHVIAEEDKTLRFFNRPVEDRTQWAERAMYISYEGVSILHRITFGS